MQSCNNDSDSDDEIVVGIEIVMMRSLGTCKVSSMKEGNFINT